MSNGIYDILGKLASLTPKEEPKQEAKKTIYESVEAKGSVLEGVSAIESKLQKEFVAEKAVSKAQQKFMGMVHATQQGEKAPSKEVAKVAKSMGKKDATDFASTKHKGLPAHVEEEVGVCAECGMNEGECEHTQVTAEGEKVKTATGIRHKGTYGTEYQGDSDEEEADQKAADTGKRGRGRPRKNAVVAKPAGEKKGRGRPRKDGGFGKGGDGGLSLQNLLIGKAPKSHPKGRVHRLGESLNFKRLMDDTNMTVDEMIGALQNDIKEFKQTGSMSEMLRDFLDLHRHNRSQADEAVNPNVPAVFRKQAAAPGEEWKATAADIDAQRTQHLSSPEGLAQRKRELGIDATAELTELAKLAGLSSVPEIEEADAPVAQPAEEPVNAPDPKFGSVKAITTQGDDMNRQKKQFASKPRLGDNPMTPELEGKLAEMYNSIKLKK